MWLHCCQRVKQAADEEETDEPEKAEPDTTDSHENVEEKTDAVNEEKVDE